MGYWQAMLETHIVVKGGSGALYVATGIGTDVGILQL